MPQHALRLLVFAERLVATIGPRLPDVQYLPEWISLSLRRHWNVAHQRPVQREQEEC